MFDHYVKLFHLTWIEPWMVEALVIMFGALLLGLIVGKTIDFLNGNQQ
jgi:hypothetical protein